jgi:N-methylhydantoinase B/oxoprolinase/acetone carboxylase alpha subunit
MAQDPNIDAAKDALDQIAAKDAVEAALIADLRAQLASMTAERDALQVLLDACDHDHGPRT